jgi:hypothetical protein
MNYLFLILLMIFLHIIDDYRLQGILASMKQKSFWLENAPDKMYRFDYIWALIMHSFSWAFMIMLPIALCLKFQIDAVFLYIFLLNLTVHAIVDDFKANKKYINLWIDQIAHICQILFTASFYYKEFCL